MRFRCPQGSIGSGYEQRLQHGETTEHLPGCFCLGPAASPLPLIWHGQLVGSSGTGVKQGDLAGPLYFAVSTHSLFCSIRDAIIERVATEYFPLLPSFVGVTAICDDLPSGRVGPPTCAPCGGSGVGPESQHREMSHHPDSAHLVEWPMQWRPGLCAALPIVTDRAKLLGLNRSRRTLSNFGRPRPARQFLRLNACHP